VNKSIIVSIVSTFILILTFSVIAFYIDHRVASDTANVKDEIMRLRAEMLDNHEKRIILMKILVMHPKIDVELAHSISDAIYKESRDFRIDPSLVLAVIEIESNFKPDAKSDKNAIGLMQVLEKWAKPPHKQCDLQVPACSIHHGTRLLHTYLEMYGDVNTALTVYNRGPSVVDLAQNTDRDPSNGYEVKVFNKYEYLKGL
jgi:soluble lytic murein transglycosylase-like protein